MEAWVAGVTVLMGLLTWGLLALATRLKEPR
jgi:hypothetical protein